VRLVVIIKLIITQDKGIAIRTNQTTALNSRARIGLFGVRYPDEQQYEQHNNQQYGERTIPSRPSDCTYLLHETHLPLLKEHKIY